MAVCRGGSPASAHIVLSTDVGPRLVPMSKGVCVGCTSRWLSVRQQPGGPWFSFLPEALRWYISLPHVDSYCAPAHVYLQL